MKNVCKKVRFFLGPIRKLIVDTIPVASCYMCLVSMDVTPKKDEAQPPTTQALHPALWVLFLLGRKMIPELQALMMCVQRKSSVGCPNNDGLRLLKHTHWETFTKKLWKITFFFMGKSSQLSWENHITIFFMGKSTISMAIFKFANCEFTCRSSLQLCSKGTRSLELFVPRFWGAELRRRGFSGFSCLGGLTREFLTVLTKMGM